MVCRTTRLKFIANLFFISILIILAISVYENISALCCVQMDAELQSVSNKTDFSKNYYVWDYKFNEEKK